MTDKQMCRELEKFANAHTLAQHVDVSITEYCKTIKAKDDSSARYEDVCLLNSIIQGAEHYLMWKRRKKNA